MNEEELYRFREEQFEKIVRVLTNYEEQAYGVTEKDLYGLLVDIQNSWEIIISEI